MTNLCRGVAVAAVILAGPAFAAEPFEGTWKIDLGSISKPTRPSERLLKYGVFTCDTCTPKVVIKADGAYHPVADDPYSDEAMVQAVDEHVVRSSYRKGGKEVGRDVSTISADGKTMTIEDTDLSTPDGKPITGHYTLTRVADGPAGAHVISGKWMRNKVDMADPSVLAYTWKMDGNNLVFSGPGGISYVAVPGGPAVPITGDIGGTMVKVEKLAPNKLREYNYRQGKLVEVGTYTVNADGKSLMGEIDNKLNGQKRSAIAYRQ